MKNKRNILFVAEELSSNGAMKSLIALLKALDTDKYSMSLFLFSHNKKGLSEQLPKSVKVLPELLPYKMLRMPLKQALIKSLKAGRLDLVCLRLLVAWQRYRRNSFSLWAFLPKIPGNYDLVCSYADGFVAPLILKKVRAEKTACWIHYLYSKVPQPEYVYKALRKCSICVPVSYEAGKALDSVLGYCVSKQVIHNIVDADECRQLANLHNDFPHKNNLIRIVSVGRVTEAKCFDIIPETALELKTQGLKFEWIIAGAGDKLEEIRDKVSDFGLEAEVIFVGELDNPLPLVKSADVFVNPSRHESWGMTVSEALCLGKVVITSNIPVFAEQIVDGKNGIMVSATPSSIAQTICRVVVDDTLRRRLGEDALNYPFTKEKVVMEFDAMVNRLLCDMPL